MIGGDLTLGIGDLGALEHTGFIDEICPFRKLPGSTPQGSVSEASTWLLSEASLGLSNLFRGPLVSFSNRSRPYAACRRHSGEQYSWTSRLGLNSELHSCKSHLRIDFRHVAIISPPNVSSSKLVVGLIPGQQYRPGA